MIEIFRSFVLDVYFIHLRTYVSFTVGKYLNPPESFHRYLDCIVGANDQPLFIFVFNCEKKNAAM